MFVPLRRLSSWASIKFDLRMSEKLGNKNVNIIWKNFFHLDEPPKQFNVISSVEMAEHVGIRNYHKFLTKVSPCLLVGPGMLLVVATPMLLDVCSALLGRLRFLGFCNIDTPVLVHYMLKLLSNIVGNFHCKSWFLRMTMGR